MSKQQRTCARVLRDRLGIREHIAPRGAFWQDHDNVLDDLIAACHGLHIGFRAQDDIRVTLAHCGINCPLIPFGGNPGASI